MNKLELMILKRKKKSRIKSLFERYNYPENFGNKDKKESKTMHSHVDVNKKEVSWRILLTPKKHCHSEDEELLRMGYQLSLEHMITGHNSIMP